MIKEDHHLYHNIEKEFNKAYVRKLLNDYFAHKSIKYEDIVYPPALQDIAIIPELTNKLEIDPYLESIDLNTGMVEVGWNLFVLGNKRLDLGISTHQNIKDLQQSVEGNHAGLPFRSNVRMQDVFDFIVGRLGEDREGQVQPMGKQQQAFQASRSIADYSGAPGPGTAGSTGWGFEKPGFMN